ncbi:MAG: N-acetyl-gamma-glutamyl-phosphate reductase, partial [Alphaproteobacteria bacterium]|nr:N-acetyl-gamma-glutamyl-phosphate reductase [Alphaproteobacteria bacterium]
MTGKAKTIRAAVLGASGYTGAETIRLLARHPGIAMTVLTADRRAGQPLGEIFPHLAGLDLPDFVRIEDADWDAVDVVFCCLPHGTTQDVVAALPERLKVVDLSADFRLRDLDAYAEWYGHAHRAPDLQETAVYGLTELARDAVRGARLVACPGCYPTSVQLPLVPLLEAGLVTAEDIIIDAKSGVSGAGRAAKE